MLLPVNYFSYKRWTSSFCKRQKSKSKNVQNGTLHHCEKFHHIKDSNILRRKGSLLILNGVHSPSWIFCRKFTTTFFTARCYASAVLAMALCLSVRPSVTSRCSTKTAKRRITQTTPLDSPGTLVFWSQRSPRNSTGVTPYEGAECRWGGSKSATFDKSPPISRKR